MFDRIVPEVFMTIINNTHPVFTKFVEESVIRGEDVEENSCHRLVRVTAVTSSVSLIVIGQTAFVNVSRALVENHEVVGWVLAIANCGAFGSVDAWSLGNLGYEVVRPLSKEEAKILKSDSSRVVDLLIRVSSFGTACLSVVPHIYMGYYYNDSSIGFALLAAFTDIWIPAHSLHLTFKSIQRKCFLNGFEKHLLQSKNALLELIQNNRNLLLTESDESIKAFVESFDRLKEFDSSLEKTQKLIELITNKPIELKETRKIRKYSRHVVQGGGVVLSGTAILLNAVIGYHFADYFTDSIVVNSLSGVFVAGSSAYLLTDLILASTGGFFDIGANLLEGKLPESWGARYQPKLTLMLKLSALVVATLSFAPSVELADENFDGYIETYMKIAAPIAFDLAAGFLLLNLVDEFMEKYLSIAGDEDAKSLMIINQRLKHLTSLIQIASLIEYAKFCKLIPADIRDRWETRVEATQNQLEKYLSEKSQIEKELQSLI